MAQVGEGASVLRGCDANVYVTSEMSHSDVLAANAQGVVVLLTGHSIIERAYLRTLREDLQEEVSAMRADRILSHATPLRHATLPVLASTP